MKSGNNLSASANVTRNVELLVKSSAFRAGQRLHFELVACCLYEESGSLKKMFKILCMIHISVLYIVIKTAVHNYKNSDQLKTQKSLPERRRHSAVA